MSSINIFITLFYRIYRNRHDDFWSRSYGNINIKILTCHRINNRSCITFTPRTNARNYLRITNGNGCWSYVGMLGGQQLLSLAARGCTWTGTVAHELMHALGLV